MQFGQFASLPSDLCKLIVTEWLPSDCAAVSRLDVVFCNYDLRRAYLDWIRGLLLCAHRKTIDEALVRWAKSRGVYLSIPSLDPFSDDMATILGSINSEGYLNVFTKSSHLIMEHDSGENAQSFQDIVKALLTEYLHSLTSITLRYFDNGAVSPWHLYPYLGKITSLILNYCSRATFIFSPDPLFSHTNIKELRLFGRMRSWRDVLLLCQALPLLETCCVHVKNMDSNERNASDIDPSPFVHLHTFVASLNCSFEGIDASLLQFVYQCPRLSNLSVVATNLSARTIGDLILNTVPRLSRFCITDEGARSFDLKVQTRNDKEPLNLHITESDRSLLTSVSEANWNVAMNVLLRHLQSCDHIKYFSLSGRVFSLLWSTHCSYLLPRELTELNLCHIDLATFDPSIWLAILSLSYLKSLCMSNCEKTVSCFTAGLELCAQRDVQWSTRSVITLKLLTDKSDNALDQSPDRLVALLPQVLPAITTLGMDITGMTSALLVDLVCALPALRFLVHKYHLLEETSAEQWQRIAACSKCRRWTVTDAPPISFRTTWPHMRRLLDSLAHSVLRVYKPMYKSYDSYRSWRAGMEVNEEMKGYARSGRYFHEDLDLFSLIV